MKTQSHWQKRDDATLIEFPLSAVPAKLCENSVYVLIYERMALAESRAEHSQDDAFKAPSPPPEGIAHLHRSAQERQDRDREIPLKSPGSIGPGEKHELSAQTSKMGPRGAQHKLSSQSSQMPPSDDVAAVDDELQSMCVVTLEG